MSDCDSLDWSHTLAELQSAGTALYALISAKRLLMPFIALRFFRIAAAFFIYAAVYLTDFSSDTTSASRCFKVC